MSQEMAGLVAGEAKRRSESRGDRGMWFIVLIVAASGTAAIVLEFVRSHVGFFAAEAIVDIVHRNNGENAIPEVGRFLDSFSRRSSFLMLFLLAMNACAATCLLILVGRMRREGHSSMEPTGADDVTEAID